MLENFNAITISQMETSEIFYSIPKVLLDDDEYKDLRLDSKILYAVLKDRLKLSAKNGWVDESGRVYLEYSNKELQELLGCSKPTILKIRQELVKFGLIFEQSQFTKADGQVANRIYVGNVIDYNPQKYKENRQKRQEEAFQKRQEKKLDRGSKNILPGASKNNTGPVTGIDTNNNKASEIDSINNLDISSRRAEKNSDEFSQPAGAEYQSIQNKTGSEYVQPEYYSLLQPIAHAYNDRVFGYPEHWMMTHKQKMIIGQHLSEGYVLSHEVIRMIEEIPNDSQSPFAYLIKCLDNLKEERRLEAKLFAHRIAEQRYG